LKAEHCWVGWRYHRRRDGKGRRKWTKVPINVRTGEPADSTDPATWSAFAEAMAGMIRLGLDGIGFVFAPDGPFAGVDIDDCRDPTTGEITPEALAIITRLNTYSEVSPSEAGVKLFLKGTLPPGGRRKGHVELYDVGRYFAATGRPLEGTPDEPAERQAELEALHAELFPPAASPRPPNQTRSAAPESVTDQELLERAKRSRNGAEFAALWAGSLDGHDGDHSAADLALVSHLAFWCGRDPGRIDRLFRQSGLMRPKWDSRRGAETYGRRTIRKALESAGERYDLRRNGRAGDREPGGARPAHEPRVSDEDDGNAPHLTDLGNARRFATDHGEALRWCDPWGKWLCWDGKRWGEDQTRGYERLARRTIAGMFREACDKIERVGRQLEGATHGGGRG
jgi:putative DNA primase/helicase